MLMPSIARHFSMSRIIAVLRECRSVAAYASMALTRRQRSARNPTWMPLCWSTAAFTGFFFCRATVEIVATAYPVASHW